jgi:hypothetical protein
MFAYCHNNPVIHADPSGFIIVVAPNATAQQEEEYEKAIAYLKTSETGRKLIEILETSSEVFTIAFVDCNNMGYDDVNNIIYFDRNSGLVLGDGKSVQSAALGLIHEMAHAAQDLEGLYSNPYVNRDMREKWNLEIYETPIAKELGEPTRSNYDDWSGFRNMQNSTHFRTVGTRPQWHYLFFWNWGKPNEVVYDHNVN